MVCEHEYMNISPPPNYRACYGTDLHLFNKLRQVGATHARIGFNLCSSGCTPLLQTLCPRNFTSFIAKAHFLVLIRNPCCRNASNTPWRLTKCSSNVLLIIQISSMYNANRCGGMCPRTFCINRENVAGLPFKPYGILVHSQNPVGDRNAVFGRSSFRPFVVTSKSALKTIFISSVLELKYFYGN